MTIKLINHGDTGILQLEGRLDTNTSPEAEQVFEQMTERFEHVVLDMAQLSYVSSAGLRVLKRLHMAMTKKKGTLELKNVNKMVMEVFEMTGEGVAMATENEVEPDHIDKAGEAMNSCPVAAIEEE